MMQKAQDDSFSYSHRSKVFTIRNEDVKTHPFFQIPVMFGEETFKVDSNHKIFCQRCLVKQFTLFDTPSGVVQVTSKKSVVKGECFGVFFIKFMQPQNVTGSSLRSVVLKVKDNLGMFEPMFTTEYEPVYLVEEPVVKLVKFSIQHLPKNDFLFAEGIFGSK